MKQILISLATIGIVSTTALGLSGAFFSDTETSSGNVLGAGAIDLQIDNTSYYNNEPSAETSWIQKDLTIEKFFNFNDVKPGDVGEDTISIHVNDNDAWLCAEVTLTSDDENGINPVEVLAGDQSDGSGSGELADRINFLWWADDGDNVLEDNETVLPGGPIGALGVGDTANVTLADSTTNIWDGAGPVPGAETKYIGKAWCFGTLTEAALSQNGEGPESDRTPDNSTGGVTCDGSNEGNQTQTDSLTADITFRAVQSRNNPDFVCAPPEEIACVEGYASSFEQKDQGTQKSGLAVLANRSDGNAALGIQQTSGLPVDPTVPAGSFYSLGFKVPTPTVGGSIVLKFTNPFFNQPGNDLQLFEATGNTNPPYPDEKVRVEISSNGVTWNQVAAAATRDALIDIGPAFSPAQYVRLTDVSDMAIFPSDADGFDLDAVKTFCTTQ